MSVRVGLLVLALGAVGAGAYVVADQAYRAPGPLTETQIVHIPKGAGVSAIAERLQAAGAVSSVDEVKIAARLRGDGDALKAGEYEFEAGASLKEILDALSEGKSISHRITVAEGLTVLEVMALVEAAPVLVGDMPERPPEGTLAPETYFVQRGETREAVMARMRAAQQKILDEAWETRAEDAPVKTKEEALILASIIEKETGVPEERGMVASVFANRLRKGMRLQTDPTVIYGITGGTGALGRRLLRKDLENPTPYNTYTNAGLPPTPIANPGPDAIKAALDPEETDYVYFVADGSGGHAFAKTLKEHERNVAAWRKYRKEKGF